VYFDIIAFILPASKKTIKLIFKNIYLIVFLICGIFNERKKVYKNNEHAMFLVL
jgi:hypothetical protein